MRKIYLLSIISFILIFFAQSAMGQVQLKRVEGPGNSLFDINNTGQGIQLGRYYDFETNTATPVEAGVSTLKSINNAGQIAAFVQNGDEVFVPGWKNGGVWSPFPDTAFEPTDNLAIEKISENGVYVVGQLWDTTQGFIYNTQTEVLTLIPNDTYAFSKVYGVNDSGIGVGSVWIDSLEAPAYFPTDGSIVVLGDFGQARAINNSNMIVGKLDMMPFTYSIDDDELSTYTADAFMAYFTDIAENGVIVGYNENDFMDRFPIIYHPSLGDQPQLLADVLTQFGIDASLLNGTSTGISPDGNYVCGYTNGLGPFVAGWAVYFDDLLITEPECNLLCPSNIVVDAPEGTTGVTIGYGVEFSCNGDTPEGTQVVLVNGLPSGSLFPVGTTLVYHELVDGDGNVLDTCGFTVTVNDYYCNSSFFNDVEPITYVEFAGIANSSPAELNGAPFNEYFLHIPPGNVDQGGTYPITLKGNTAGDWTDFFTVFIDWNQDGDFDDADEIYEIGSITNSTGEDDIQLTGEITVPGDAMPGTTRMRVVKEWDESPIFACDEYLYGQTEDYLLTVTEKMAVNDLNQGFLSYYPNPVKDFLTIDAKKNIENISIYNLAGQSVLQNVKAVAGKVNMSSLSSGVYVFRVTLEGGQVETFKVIKK